MNFIFALSEIFKNGAILINGEIFYQEEHSLQADHFQFLRKNPLMVETIKKQSSKTKIL